MSRFRVVLLSLSAVLAFGAIASTSASADSCNGGSHFVFCYWPSNTPIHLLWALGEDELSLLAGKVGTVEIRLHCKDSLFATLLHLLGLALGEIDFLGCSAEKPANCDIAPLQVARFHLQVTSTTTDTAKGSLPGEELTNLELLGASCPLPGKFAITGSQLLEFPEGGTGKLTHQIVAQESRSNLKFGTETITFSSTASVHLESYAFWLIMAEE